MPTFFGWDGFWTHFDDDGDDIFLCVVCFAMPKIFEGYVMSKSCGFFHPKDVSTAQGGGESSQKKNRSSTPIFFGSDRNFRMLNMDLLEANQSFFFWKGTWESNHENGRVSTRFLPAIF